MVERGGGDGNSMISEISHSMALGVRKEFIETTYLFFEYIDPKYFGESSAVSNLLRETTELSDKVEYNTKYFRR